MKIKIKEVCRSLSIDDKLLCNKKIGTITNYEWVDMGNYIATEFNKGNYRRKLEVLKDFIINYIEKK